MWPAGAHHACPTCDCTNGKALPLRPGGPAKQACAAGLVSTIMQQQYGVIQVVDRPLQAGHPEAPLVLGPCTAFWEDLQELAGPDVLDELPAHSAGKCQHGPHHTDCQHE